DEPGDLRGSLHDVPGLVVELHVDQDVPGEEHPGGRLLAPFDQLHDLFGRHQDVSELVLLAESPDALLQGRLGLLLVAGVGVNDVPVFWHRVTQCSTSCITCESTKSTAPRYSAAILTMTRTTAVAA